MRLFRKSLYAPTGLKVNESSLQIGDKFVKNLLVNEFPPEFELGMLSLYVSNPNVKVYRSTNPSSENISKALNRELKDINERFKSTKDHELQERLKQSYNSLEMYIKELVASKDTPHNVVMVFSITANSKEELKRSTFEYREQLRQAGFETIPLQFLQLELLKFVTPLFIDDDIPTVIKNQYGVVTPSTSVAGMYPYTFQKKQDYGGLIFGREKNQAGIFQFDPFLYKNNSEKAKSEGITNGNIVIVGQSGAGKTIDMGLIFRYCVMMNYLVVSIDPENKNQYLTKKFGGNYIRWGSRDAMINMFDLKPVSTEDEEDDVDPYDTELAIYNVIDEVKNIFRLQLKDVKSEELDLLSDIVISLFSRFDINFDTDFRGLLPEAMPTLSDFNHEVSIAINNYSKTGRSTEVEHLVSFQARLRPMLIEHKYYFDGHTTIRFEDGKRRILAFGSRSLQSKSKELKASLNYLMFRYAWGLCLNEKYRSAFMIDEFHVMALEGRSAEESALYSRRSRKYSNLFVVGTQEPEDLASDVLGPDGVAVSVHGRAVMNNSSYKDIKYLEKDSLEALCKLITLNDTETEVVSMLTQGDSLFSYGKNRMAISVIATEKELIEIQGSIQ